VPELQVRMHEQNLFYDWLDRALCSDRLKGQTNSVASRKFALALHSFKNLLDIAQAWTGGHGNGN